MEKIVLGVNPQNVVNNRNAMKEKWSHKSTLKGRAHLRYHRRLLNFAGAELKASRPPLLEILMAHSR